MVANEDTSKKQSAASLPSPPEDGLGSEAFKEILMDAAPDWVFFVDRCLGRRIIPEMLRSAGEIVRAHDEVFRQDTRDEKWLTEVGKNGWIVLTKDKNSF